MRSTSPWSAPRAAGYLTAWSGAGAAPTASTLNFTAGKTVANLVVLPVSPCAVCTGTAHNLPSIKLLNGSHGNADILIDIWGFYDDGAGALAGGNYFKPLASPTRILDTRSGFGGATTFAPATAKAISNTVVGLRRRHRDAGAERHGAARRPAATSRCGRPDRPGRW